MRVTPPGAIAILSACLKRAGYNNIELFDATWYPCLLYTSDAADGVTV